MNLSGNISDADRQRVRDMDNTPAFDSDFGDGGSSGDSFDDLFGGDSMDDIFGSDDDIFGGNGGGSSDSGGFDDIFGSDSGFGNDNGFGNNSGFGNNGFGNNNGFNSPFGSPTQNPAAPQGPDKMDVAIDAGIDAAKTTGEILVELFRSIKLRNVDDFGYLSRNLMLSGGGITALGIVLSLVGGFSDMPAIGLTGIGGQLALCGGLLVSSGISGIGVSALILDKVGARDMGGTVEDIKDIPAEEDNVVDQLEDMQDSDFDNLFAELDSDDDNDASIDDFFNGNDLDDLDDAIPEEPEEDEEEEFEPDIDLEPQALNLDEALNNIAENQVLCRESLFNTFLPLFPTETPKFADKEDMDPSDENFEGLKTACLKALANVSNMKFADLTLKIQEEYGGELEFSVVESFFAFQIKMFRVVNAKKLEDFAHEIEVYVRDNSDDEATTVTVVLEGDFYKITITKGESAVVTFGDVFKQAYCRDFFTNTKYKLPVICGIDELGKVILGDAKNYDTMLIAGKPRSGKSWYVLSILMCLILFNTPEDVQFCIIDPKEANLFKTMALLPHVCGLHNDEHVLKVLDDIIDNEAPRRKKLLSDNRVDDIWGLRKKGIKVPILYVVIDEYITVINNLKSKDDKDAFPSFNVKIQTLISQLPSLGIRLIFVPHRATGIVDKTNRTMIQYYACVRGDIDDVNDTLGLKNWKRALTRPGDIAMRSSDMKNAAFVRGAALTTDDTDNAIFMENAAKAFYKMGVTLPDMSNMAFAANRDEDWIKQELSGENVIQYDAQELENASHQDLSSLASNNNGFGASEIIDIDEGFDDADMENSDANDNFDDSFDSDFDDESTTDLDDLSALDSLDSDDIGNKQSNDLSNMDNIQQQDTTQSQSNNSDNDDDFDDSFDDDLSNLDDLDVDF